VRFHKYQALGNDYLVVDDLDRAMDAALAQKLCDRNYGVGSDGVLVRDDAAAGKFALRIFNPDGSEAEKSGNGLRIFARYLWDQKLVGSEPFEIVTKGGVVSSIVRDGGRNVFVEMGRASFDSERIPVVGAKREVVSDTLEIDGVELTFTALTVGNPHCVIHCDEVSPALARRVGPLLETHPLFPNRTNVQFVKVLDRKRIQIEIWERGAGYTLASGSSSCAAASASVKLGLCDAGEIEVAMPGGKLQIGVSADFALTMFGAVGKVAEGVVAAELLEN
jgi:diaminopimelate epimerase